MEGGESMKKRKERSLGNIDFQDSDISAILCVLPLMLQIETGDNDRDFLYSEICNRVVQKLTNHKSSYLTANEIRIISTAVSAAIDFISGKNVEYGLYFKVDPEWSEEIRGHFFTLNRLNSIFLDYVNLLNKSH